VKQFSLSPDGRTVIAVLDLQGQTSFMAWETEAGKPIVKCDSRKGRDSLTAGVAGLVGSARTDKPLVSLASALLATQDFLEKPVREARFAPDGRTVFISTGDELRILDSTTGNVAGLWSAESGWSRGVMPVISPYGKSAFERLTGNPPSPGKVVVRGVLRDYPSGRIRGTLPQMDYREAVFTADSQTLAVRVLQGQWSYQVFDARTAQLRHTFSNRSFDFSLSAGERFVLTQPAVQRNDPGQAVWWDLATGREIARIQGLKEHVTWAPDGLSLYGTFVEGVKRFRMEDGTEMAVFKFKSPDTRFWNSPVFFLTSDIRSLIAATTEGIKQFRTADGAEVACFKDAGPAFAVTPDGSTLLAAVPEGVRVWNLATGQERGTLPHHASPFGFALHPRGPTLVDAKELWNLQTGEHIVPQEGDLSPFAAVLDGRLRINHHLVQFGFIPFLAMEDLKLVTKEMGFEPGTLLLTDQFRLTKDNRAVQLWPIIARSSQAEGAMDRVMELVGNRPSEKAIAALRKALQETPKDVVLHLKLADLLEQQGQFVEAVAALDEACKLDPSHAWLFADFARTLLRGNKPEQAAKTIERALRFLPDSAELHFLHGEALFAAGFPDRAVAENEKATVSPAARRHAGANENPIRATFAL
jgi:Tfp pilus assembly protein PilF